MAENKKSFIAYSDWNGMFKILPDEVAGKLIKHIFSYVNDESPETDDFVINALFEQIKSTLKRDLKKWEQQREQRSAAGKRSAEVRATKLNERSTVVNETERKATVSVSVNDNVNTNVLNIRQIEDWILELKKQDQFLEGLYMTHKFKSRVMGKIALKFKEHLKMYPKTHKDFLDFRNHFKSWVDMKVKKGQLDEYLKNRVGEL